MIQRIYELKNFPRSQFFCKVLYGSDTFAQSASSLLLAAIAWDRTLLLFFPQKRTSLSARVLIAFSCLIALCASLPKIYHYGLAEQKREFNDGSVEKQILCVPM